tara:strand:- start:58 stop:483 length:426 start_codon:yes stop_codon:yes gene_type:complete
MAALDLNIIRSDIEQRLSNELRKTPPTSVVFGNQPFNPTPGKNFVQCLIEFTGSEYITLGGTTNSTNNLTGLITINIFTKIGVGTGSNFILAKRIKDLYNRVKLNDIFFDPATGPAIIENAAPEGFVQSVMSIPFEIYEDL